ncbi:hypothetical protein [Polaromonas sp. CG_9.11]|uniref:hypothetical protein n=1 Tax=Polaromonas sp. CG_9.11 TaxID=2787730 RepID=UPI0018CAA3BB|nr:hypothetical protein [Polaromonas sp. CG_9.11]MBG6074202.1 hypothetical protein [Polaromonas sp. CG_9.11]
MNIIQSEKTPEFLARRIGNVSTDLRSFSSTMLLFGMTSSELVDAISFRPEIAQELEQESHESDAIALVWSRAKAGLDAQAAAKAFDDVLSHHSRITLASHF